VYKKGKMKIYDVHLDMKSHPTLKTKDGDKLDIWVVDDPEQVEQQMKAIKK